MLPEKCVKGLRELDVEVHKLLLLSSILQLGGSGSQPGVG
jgi:hypothetical protein